MRGNGGAPGAPEADLAGLEKERGQIVDELALLAGVLESATASVDELEKSLVRQQALQLRGRAVEGRIAALQEQQRAEEKRQRLAESQRIAANAELIEQKLLTEIEACLQSARGAARMRQEAATLAGTRWSAAPVANIVKALEEALLASGLYTRRVGADQEPSVYRPA
jgi:hypothetical protein